MLAREEVFEELDEALRIVWLSIITAMILLSIVGLVFIENGLLY